MRLDVFLKISRLIPRRSLAQTFCDSGLVYVNGTKAKSAKEVNTGDEITIVRRDRRTVVNVIGVPQKKQISKQTAGDLYEVIQDEKVELP